jgi:hypothetical protein
LAGALGVVVLAAAASSAIAGPQASSDSVVDGTHIHQEINVWGPDTIHYWFRAENPAGVRPFCVTLRLERKTSSGWRGIGKKGRDQGCCPQPDEECFSETSGAWDLFLYPRGKIRRKVMDGSLRIRGFSDFGPELTLRIAGPPA